ncbi:uncharacterized protein LOC101860536 [Aplysia californica]|uniref:Uncharacterized protein LOC101860536 n=1 Tax=Aplysia californica TaxID=6500 RepID=A0ABM0JAG1_APLCA|nr:uncharacterized protein LOC101860536 [Aplysia californica]XP_005089163.1 uncharacterized protein LOC101860536 [Aplysia californica]XP_012934628.1 uncharacterized protein LOC101860536 [Aplysia californica]
MAEAPEEPSFAADESSEPGFVRLKVKIAGLKVKSQGILGFFGDLIDKHGTPQGKNAKIEAPAFDERGFELNVEGDGMGAMKGAKYRLKFERLPYTIVPRHSYIKGEDGWIFVFLKKENVDQSWEKFIRDGKLETAEKTEET